MLEEQSQSQEVTQSIVVFIHRICMTKYGNGEHIGGCQEFCKGRGLMQDGVAVTGQHELSLC
mgnify:CR=1 FL=1